MSVIPVPGTLVLFVPGTKTFVLVTYVRLRIFLCGRTSQSVFVLRTFRRATWRTAPDGGTDQSRILFRRGGPGNTTSCMMMSEEKEG